jgi:hypothetical protein
MAQADNNATVQSDKGSYRQINKALNVCVFEDYLDSQRERLPILADVDQLTPRVLRVLGQNPGRVSTDYQEFYPNSSRTLLTNPRSLHTKARTLILLAPGSVG